MIRGREVDINEFDFKRFTRVLIKVTGGHKKFTVDNVRLALNKNVETVRDINTVIKTLELIGFRRYEKAWPSRRPKRELPKMTREMRKAHF